MEQLDFSGKLQGFTFDKIRNKTSNSIVWLFWWKEKFFYYEWFFLWVLSYDYDENNKILKIWYVKSMNIKLDNKIKWLWTYMIEKLIEEYNPRKLIIDTPLMESRKFWFKIVRKLYKEWKFKNVKFVRNGFRKEYNSMPDIIKNNSKINHAFSKIILENE